MKVAVVIASHGDERWRDLAYSRAYPSAVQSGADEVLIEHDPDADWRADVRNRLTARVKDGYVVTLDADDELASGYCDALRKALLPMSPFEQPALESEEKTFRRDDPIPGRPADFALLTPQVQYVRNGRRYDPRFWPECDLEDHNWMVCGTAFPKSLFDRVGGWRKMTATGVPNEWDDWELWIRMTKAGARVVKVPDAVYVAHVNAKSASQRASGPQRSAWLSEVRDLHFQPDCR